jgi:hypothetical protein
MRSVSPRTHMKPSVLTVVVALSLTGCSTETVLDCSTEGPAIRDIIRIRARQGSAEDLSFSPARSGTATVTDNEYTLRFTGIPPGYELLFRINRFTSGGTRELIGPDGKTINGAFYLISCKPYTEKGL